MDRKFFSKVLKPDWQKSYRLLAKLINTEFKPTCVVDYGCASGWLLEYLRRTGVEVLGVEPNEAAFEYSPDGALTFIKVASIAERLELGRDFDLAVCLEVGEHIDARYADMVVANVCRRSDYVLWSAATPGQGGCGHVNEQPHAYWDEKFERLGFHRNAKRTTAIRRWLKLKRAKKWYFRNSTLYVNELA